MGSADIVKEILGKLQKYSLFQSKVFLFFLLGLPLVLGLGGCSKTDYTWGWYSISPWHPTGLTNIQFLISGLGYTLLVSFSAIVLSILLGLIVALPALTDNTLARRISRVYVEIFRSIPVSYTHLTLPTICSV